MSKLAALNKEQLQARLAELQAEYAAYQARGLNLDMSRGKPCAEQMELTMELADCVNARTGAIADNHIDTRN